LIIFQLSQENGHQAIVSIVVRCTLLHERVGLIQEEQGFEVFSDLAYGFKLLLKGIINFNAVLLLDEADAFIEQRTSYHDTHNRLVTIFLRKLEYYQGILFLTSNRGIQFDNAILSRIHLIIKYENLTREFRRDLWSNFLSKAYTMKEPAVVEEHELRRLESLALNRSEVGV
jgi:hypothetical protein